MTKCYGATVHLTTIYLSVLEQLVNLSRSFRNSVSEV